MKNDENDILKMLALQAKMRMKKGAYSPQANRQDYSKSLKGMKMLVTNLRADYRLMALSTKEDEEIFAKVKNLVNGDEEILNPIKFLIDSRKYEELDEVEKTRYVLSVSEKYRNYKRQCEKEIV